MDNTQIPPTTAQNTIKEIKKLRVDSLYGKRKHYNAADRKHISHLRLGIPSMVLSVFLGTSLLAIAADKWPDYVNWINAGLAAIVALLSGLQTYHNYEKCSALHKTIATRYLSIAKECSRLIAYFKDGLINYETLRKQLEELAAKMDFINRDAEACPTSPIDYEKAQQGFREGEEDYEECELR